MTRFATLALSACIAILVLIIAIEVVAPRPAAQHSVIPGSDAGRRTGASAPVPDESEPARWNLSRQGPAQRVDRDPLGAPSPTIAAPIAGRKGTATWCAPTPTLCRGWGGDAHLGAVASFRWGDRPYRVTVCTLGADRRCTHVLVVSHCECRRRTLIDLSPAAFRELAPLSVGRVRVVLTFRGVPLRIPEPPRTDADG